MVVAPEPLDGLVVDSVVELRSGGWLATAHVSDDVETIVGYLLRSTDGLVWENVWPPSLPPCDSGGPGTAFTTPVPFRDGWLTAYHCIDVIQPQRSEAFTIDAAGNTLTPIPGTRRDGDVTYETAVTVGDDVIIAGTREASEASEEGEDGEADEDDEQADERELSLDLIRISP